MLKVLVAGLGPIGFAAARAVRAEDGVKLVGLVDSDADQQGRTLPELGELGAEPARDQCHTEPRVCGSIAQAIAAGGPADVAILTTTSRFDVQAPLVQECLEHGLAVLSSCEELAWPWYRHAELAAQVDQRARAAGRAVLGTGVNPGFVMDRLPVVLATMLRRVTAVRCVRRLNAGLRRTSLQQKIGATLAPARFAELAARRELGHEGLAESAAMLAAGLGRSVAPGSVEETLEPVLATSATESALGLIQPGQVAGIHHVARWSGEGLTLELDLTMAVGVTDPADRVTLDGPVQLNCKIPGAIPGDSATVAALLNHIKLVHEAPAGLRTMLEVPCPGCHNLELLPQGAASPSPTSN